MKFLVVAPRYKEKIGLHYEFPLGLAYIYSSLKEQGYFVECLNLNYHHSLEAALEEKIIGKGIDVVCTGGLSVHFNKIKPIFDASRRIKPDIITIAGGGLVSSQPELIVKALNIDFGVMGEGEKTILELADVLVNSKDFSKIDSIIYYNKIQKKIIKNKLRDPIKNIDSIPYPDYEAFQVNQYLDMQMPTDDHYLYPYDKPRMLPIISSRSCPYACTFCYHPLGKEYRQRSLEAFFKEVDYLIKRYNINMLAILDELFGFDFNRVEEFCQRMRKYNLKWMTQMRVDKIDKKILDLLKDSGCFQLSLGLESASDLVLKNMKKHISLSQIENALELTYNAKIGIQGNFIFGDPAETLETANQTLNWWLDHKKYQINLTRIIPYPGSEIYYKALNKGLIKDKIKFIEAGCYPLNITEMSNDSFLKLMRLIEIYNMKYNKFPTRMLSCKKEGLDLYKGPFYTVKAKCPHCHKIIRYKNMHQAGIGTLMTQYGCRIGCRECNQRFDLLGFEPLKLKLRKKLFSFLIYLFNTKVFAFIYKKMLSKSILVILRNIKQRITR